MEVSVLDRKDYDSNGRAVMTRHRGGGIDRKGEERCTEHSNGRAVMTRHRGGGIDHPSSWPSWELCKQRMSGRHYDCRLKWESPNF